jgi:anaerobic glycerol-3-phosphate dehydrogenase
VRIAVIGGGVAGTAAAWAARRGLADVTAIFDRAGASSLYSGALDDVPWEEGGLDAPLDSEVLAFSVALDAWSVGTKSARVATPDGVLRPARGRDSSLLDVAAVTGGRVAVVSTRVDGWDAPVLARSLAESAWARRTRTRFEVVHVDDVFDAAEGRASVHDLATLHDDPERLKRLAARLRERRDAPDAWLFGPWLGAAPGVGEALSQLLGKPCGETTSLPGGPAGARFDVSRDALLANGGVQIRQERIQSLEPRGKRHLVAGSGGGLTTNDGGFDAVILAIGGLVGGGIVLNESAVATDDAALASGSLHWGAFRPSVRSRVEIGLSGRTLDRASSERGLDLAALGMTALERVGILCDGAVARGASSIFVAGDVVADHPRTALGAARSGILAARAALSLAREVDGEPRAAT